MTFGIVGKSLDLWREVRSGYVDFGIFSAQRLFKILNLKTSHLRKMTLKKREGVPS